MTVYEMAVQYYPRLWGKERIDALVEAGRLTREEADAVLATSEVTGAPQDNDAVSEYQDDTQGEREAMEGQEKEVSE